MNNTKRPISITPGTNVLIGRDGEALRRKIKMAVQSPKNPGSSIPFWNGKALERIANILLQQPSLRGKPENSSLLPVHFNLCSQTPRAESCS